MNTGVERVREQLAAAKLDALVVSRREDQLYLAGFAGDADFDSVLFVSANDAKLATDFRYIEMAQAAAPDWPLIRIKRKEYEIGAALAEWAASHGLTNIGFESQHVPYGRVRDWQKAGRKVKLKLRPTEDIIKWIRAVKDEGEIDKIRRTVQLADQAFAFFCGRVRPGMTERQAAWLIETFMREHGAQAIGFPFIIASGPNAALPHAAPTDRPMQLGEPITIDIGAQVEGYRSDMTRTIVLGEPTPKFREIYDIVHKAVTAVEKKARPGMKGKQIDALARRVIEKAGYGEAFGHGLGHGVGLAVHEFPRAGRMMRDEIKPNMTLTVEPGIYLPGWGGVRIEDLAIFRENGMEVLTQSTKDPIVRVAGTES